MIRIGICGYGNLARGVEAAVYNSKDMELLYVFTRRNSDDIELMDKRARVYNIKDILAFKDKIDVLILCGGSRNDLPSQTPELAQYFNVVDSFDNHHEIYNHYNNVNEVALRNKKTAIISTGWDPGMFSLNRLIMEGVLPNGNDYTFWGRGVSQGHSDAIRRIDGVLDARQYTIPIEDALAKVRNGENPTLAAKEKHRRECYVVAKPGADLKKIENEIKTMPDYFAPYDTTVHFISSEELKRDHSGIPHGGVVIRSGSTGMGLNNKHTIEYSLKLSSNPEFTGSVLASYARACYRLSLRGDFGCKTVFDIAPRDISPRSYEDLLKNTL